MYILIRFSANDLQKYRDMLRKANFANYKDIHELKIFENLDGHSFTILFKFTGEDYRDHSFYVDFVKNWEEYIEEYQLQYIKTNTLSDEESSFYVWTRNTYKTRQSFETLDEHYHKTDFKDPVYTSRINKMLLFENANNELIINAFTNWKSKEIYYEYQNSDIKPKIIAKNQDLIDNEIVWQDRYLPMIQIYPLLDK